VSATLRIAILEPGAPPRDLRPRFGAYGDMVARLLGEDFAAEPFDVRKGRYPEGQDWDGYVITGSAAGVYDPDPWIPDLKAWVRDTAGTAPMVGICFGHQLMAEAFGGRVVKSPKGWGVGLQTYDLVSPPDWIDAGAKTMTLPVSHQDQVVEVGEEARVIGGSDFCPFGFLAYPAIKAASMQPHPEFDPAFAVALIDTRADGPLTPEHAAAAIASLSGANDNARVADWLRRFLQTG